MDTFHPLHHQLDMLLEVHFLGRKTESNELFVFYQRDFLPLNGKRNHALRPNRRDIALFYLGLVEVNCPD